MSANHAFLSSIVRLVLGEAYRFEIKPMTKRWIEVRLILIKSDPTGAVLRAIAAKTRDERVTATTSPGGVRMELFRGVHKRPTAEDDSSKPQAERLEKLLLSVRDKLSAPKPPTRWRRDLYVETMSFGRGCGMNIAVRYPVRPDLVPLLEQILNAIRLAEVEAMTAEKADRDGEDAPSPREELERIGARVYAPNETATERVAGYPEAQALIAEHLLLPITNSHLYEQVAATTRVTPSSVVLRALLFAGPPGCGKTLAARSIASATDIPLIYIPIEAIVSKWYGASERRLAEVFDAAAKIAPAILFLDEIECLAGSRDNAMHEATRRILSVLLRRLDGLLALNGVVVIGATNRPQDLDPALQSRFGETIDFPLPSVQDRRAILASYAKHLSDEELLQVAATTDGQSGRDLRHLCDRAERNWVAVLAREGRAASPPPVQRYLDAMRFAEAGDSPR